MRIKPECRVCSAQVEYMGQYCSNCAEYEDDYEENPIYAEDQRRMVDRTSAEDY
jgi:predicted amidophosphoribosyltransferase